MTLPKPRPDLDACILKTLKKSPLSTKDLAAACGEENTKIYHHCHRLEEKEALLDSELVDGTLLLFCTHCKKVVTGKNYEKCKKAKHQFAAFYNKERVWSLSEPG